MDFRPSAQTDVILSAQTDVVPSAQDFGLSAQTDFGLSAQTSRILFAQAIFTSASRPVPSLRVSCADGHISVCAQPPDLSCGCSANGQGSGTGCANSHDSVCATASPICAPPRFSQVRQSSLKMLSNNCRHETVNLGIVESDGFGRRSSDSRTSSQDLSSCVPCLWNRGATISGVSPNGGLVDADSGHEQGHKAIHW